MEDKIIEIFKKYSKSVDTEYNVYNCLIEEDFSNIAKEIVKLFCQPAVMGELNCEHEWMVDMYDHFGFPASRYCDKCDKREAV